MKQSNPALNRRWAFRYGVGAIRAKLRFMAPLTINSGGMYENAWQHSVALPILRLC